MRSFGTAERVGSTAAKLGEGPRWDAEHERLLWVDIRGCVLHAGERAIRCDSNVCAAAPWGPDTVLVALADALAAVHLADGAVRRLAEVRHARPEMRLNDGACDPQGRFWVGSMTEDESPGAGALYRFDPDGALHTVLTGVGLSNGLGWTADGRRMYYVDSLTQRVDLFDFDGASGAISNRRPFATIPEGDGIPDGLALDDEDGVWVALHGGGEVRRFSPDGTVSGQVEAPARETTACCFAGRRLFVTAAEGLFALNVPYSGPPARPFAGRPPTP